MNKFNGRQQLREFKHYKETWIEQTACNYFEAYKAPWAYSLAFAGIAWKKFHAKHLIVEAPNE